MSPNRRDIIKLAAGLGLTAAIPTSAERIAAAEVLNQRISDNPVLDPGTFAVDANSTASNSFGNDWFCAVNAEADADWRHKREVLFEAMPELRNVRPGHPYIAFEESLFNFVQQAYSEGLRHGAAFENLRREVIGDLSQCRTCWGIGLTEQGYTCTSCGGTGIVATGVQNGVTGGGD